MKSKRRFYPLVRPYKRGYLKTSDAYKIYYELYGNKNGIPLIYHHGGPGGAPEETKAKYYSKKEYHVCLYHQRGCGKSKPLGIKQNRTPKLVDDSKHLMDKFGWRSAVHVGNSWGTTLAICFAIAHPQMVKALVLQGVYLAGRRETDAIYTTQLRKYNPEAYSVFTDVPNEYKKKPFDYHYKNVFSQDKKVALDAVKNIFAAEGSIIEPGFSYTMAKEYIKDLTWNESLKILPEYMKKYCFLPTNYIIENIKKIKDIPTIIIQGKDDYVCPPKYAQKLASKLNKCTLHLVKGGHLMSVGEKKQILLKELRELPEKIR